MVLEPVKVGVVGAGNMGVHHARIYNELPQTELVGIVDISEARGRFCADKYQTEFISNYQDLIGRVDAVNIVVRDYERDGALEVDLFYADDVFDANYRFDDALRHVLTLIDAALEQPDAPFGDIDMLTAADRRELDLFAHGARIDA